MIETVSLLKSWNGGEGKERLRRCQLETRRDRGAEITLPLSHCGAIIPPPLWAVSEAWSGLTAPRKGRHAVDDLFLPCSHLEGDLEYTSRLPSLSTCP